MAQHNKLMFNHWENLVSSVRNEMVFEGRNKEYGAYQLRRNYNRTITLALLITLFSFTLGVSIPKILDLLEGSGTEELTVPIDLTNENLLDEPPPIDETEPPPPPPPPPPPVQATVKFVPPVIEDDPVEDEEPPPIQEEETQIATVTQEGEGEEEIIIPEETGTGIVEAANEVFTIVEEMPSFPGGEAAMYKYLEDNIKYPSMESEAGISGTVYVTFVVETDGSITDVKVLRGVPSGPNLAKEAVAKVKKMPKWKAGKQNGRPVRVQYNMPVKFQIR